jgi:hypothetical protein
VLGDQNARKIVSPAAGRLAATLHLRAGGVIETGGKVSLAGMRSSPYLLPSMFNEDDFHYAIENTEVVRAPEARIQTFGSTSFRFFLVTELMDTVNSVRIRDGRVHAERPQIITPSHISRLLLDGFGEEAQGFAEWLRRQGSQLAILKYGFQFRKGDVTESVVRSPIESVLERVNREVDALDDPLSAIIQGVDDAWEVCLLKFAIDMILRSSGENLGDLRKQGLF